jgi:thiaminase (transcriptional activator TenA)
MRILLVLLLGLLPACAQQFSDELWREAKPIYEKTLQHPFLKGLADGTLPEERFRFYMLQDARYLGQYSKALSIVASKAPNEDAGLFFNNGAMNCIRTERKLHETYFRPEDLKILRMAPTNVAYTNHLLASAYAGGFGEGVAAIAPCYWIYAEVGRELKKRGSKSPAYQRWIDQYAGEDFQAAVKKVLGHLNAEAAKTDAAGRQILKDLFLQSVRYEYLFWDMAWREETWLP